MAQREQDILRVDARDKVTGRTKYAADLVFDGILYTKSVRADLPHGKLLAVHTAAALAAEGVRWFSSRRQSQKLRLSTARLERIARKTPIADLRSSGSARKIGCVVAVLSVVIWPCFWRESCRKKWEKDTKYMNND